MKKITTLFIITLSAVLTSCSQYDTFPPDDSFIAEPHPYLPFFINPTAKQKADLSKQ